MIKRNSLIDGWRGLSVLMVVVGHLVTFRFPQALDTSPIHALISRHASTFTWFGNMLFRILSPIGEVGVSFFFVISGYLITHLLLIEENRTSKINIAAFYVRRVCRIAPAFYVYLLTVFVLFLSGLIEADYGAFIRSAAYVCNFSEFKCSWWLAHTWSLSVEEQFYLVWPLMFSFFVGSRTAIIAMLLVIVSIASIFFQPFYGFSYIATGALVASSDTIRSALTKIATPSIVLTLGCVILLHPLFRNISEVSYVIQVIAPFITAIIFFGTLEGRGPFVCLVSSLTVQRVGIISYSLYLWQQIGTAPMEWGGTSTGAGAGALSVCPGRS